MIACFVVLACLATAAPAAATPQTKIYRFGPVKIGPYQVKQDNFSVDIPKPAEDGYVTGMGVDVVDPDGSQVPISRLMLHHIVFSNLGEHLGERHDGTCNDFTMLDSKTHVPAVAERFDAAGEERAKLRMPPGYGYPVKGKDKWAMTYMLMNHKAKTDQAYIQYTVTYDTAHLTPVKPYWLDIKNCLTDPVFNIPGGKKKGSTTRRSATWTVPKSGRIVAGFGHVHGGAKSLTLNRAGCQLYDSRPTWGLKSHPFYNVKPVLHEPGPINMSGFTSSKGYPVRRGEKLRLDANYDGELLHTRVMGILVVFMATDSSVKATSKCKQPSDLRNWGPEQKGRTKPPRFTVPLTGLKNGIARRISAPPGQRVRLASGSSIEVGDRFFSKHNVLVSSGSILKWKFDSKQLHNVTVANGPRGFASVHLNGGRGYKVKLKTPGTYRIFCALHPVSMTETVKVVRKRR
jgi:plastocyanin